MKLQRLSIVVTSNEPWGDIWYSKQNYAFELSRRNQVFFIDPCRRWSLSNVPNGEVYEHSVTPSLTVLAYQNAFPASSRLLFAWNNRIVSRRLCRYFRARGVRDFLLWSFDPYRLYDPALLGARTSIFHSVDRYDPFPLSGALLSRRVDHVFCIARPLMDRYRRLNRSVHFVPHALSADQFVSDEPCPPGLPANGYGLFIGGIDERLDYAMIEAAVTALPETPFLFLGRLAYNTADSAARRLFEDRAHRNLIAPGPIPFAQLKPYIANARFCIAFMNKHDPGAVIGHQKLIQYLAFGKAVFGCVFSDYADFPALMYMDDDNDALLGKLVRFVRDGEASDLRETRIAFAAQRRFDVVLERVEDLL